MSITFPSLGTVVSVSVCQMIGRVLGRPSDSRVNDIECDAVPRRSRRGYEGVTQLNEDEGRR